MSLNLGNQLQFKCDLEQNTFWNLILENKVERWKYFKSCNTMWESSKCIISFSPKGGGKTLQYSEFELCLGKPHCEVVNQHLLSLELFFVCSLASNPPWKSLREQGLPWARSSLHLRTAVAGTCGIVQGTAAAEHNLQALSQQTGDNTHSTTLHTTTWTYTYYVHFVFDL
jgi:hypothetical protein